ncbi:hypothetical protein JOB18_040775 [Solea senegalensis]|nr:progranulin-like [Solea senegalensis]KAG7501139.1 hypothetical protein JOB18_040775 [Solea senegalensis]
MLRITLCLLMVVFVCAYPNELINNQVPELKRVHCDNYYTCPDGTTCCRHPQGVWFCCPYSPGRCCLDGYHCCPYGFDCDLTYTHCLRRNLRYPFTPKQAFSSVPASLISPPDDEASAPKTPMTALIEASDGAANAEVIHCDSRFYCPQGTSCCKDVTGQWSCCPYPLGQCCKDGRHCCQYGYTCDPGSISCRRFYSQVPSGDRKQVQTV